MVGAAVVVSGGVAHGVVAAALGVGPGPCLGSVEVVVAMWQASL